MTDQNNNKEYRITTLERKVAGLQRQLKVIHARQDATDAKTERRLRDLEIKTASYHVPQRKLAEIYQLSEGRISQIIKKVS